MKITLLRLVFILFLANLSTSHAQESLEESPQKYQLELIWIYGTGSTHEYVFVLGKVGYKTVAALKERIAGLKEGSIVEWDPGCIRMGQEPLLSSEKDMKDFAEFCKKEKVNLVIRPAG
jgi:hypothetical protein